MPWSVVHRKHKWFVKNKDTGKMTPKEGYDSQAKAEKYKQALYANAGDEASRADETCLGEQIAAEIGKGHDPDQAIAIAYSQCGEQARQEPPPCRFVPVRSLAQPQEIEGYLALWGSPDVRDCYDTYFSREQPPQLDLDFLPIPIRYAHGQDPEIGAEAVGAMDRVWLDDQGIKFHGILNTEKGTYPRVAQEVRQGILATSSGTNEYLAEFAPDGRFVTWPITEVSLTDKPCEYRMPAVMAIRSRDGIYELSMQPSADDQTTIDDPRDCECSEAGQAQSAQTFEKARRNEDSMPPKPSKRAPAIPGVPDEKPAEPPAEAPKAPKKPRVGLSLSQMGLGADATVQDVYDTLCELLGDTAGKAVFSSMMGESGEPPETEALPADMLDDQTRYAPDTRPEETTGQEPEDIEAPRSDAELLQALRTMIGNQRRNAVPAARAVVPANGEVNQLRQEVRQLRALLVDETNAPAPNGPRFNRTTPPVRDMRDLRYDGQKAADLAYACRLLEAVGKTPTDSLLRATSYQMAREMEQGTPVGSDMTVQYFAPFRSVSDVMSTDVGHLRNEYSKSRRSNEVMGDANTGYGSNYVGVFYDTSLWLKVRAMPVWRELEARGMEEKVIPVGYASDVIPLEGADFTWYRVPETVDIDATGRPKINITPGVAGTSSQTLTVRTLGALVYYSVLLEEDSIVPMAAELNRKANIQTQERIEYVVFNGDTATGTGNLNYKNGTVNAADVMAFTTANGILKTAIYGNSGANARAASGLSDLDFQLLFGLLGASNNAITGSDPSKLLFVTDPSTGLACDRLPIFKTPNVNNNATIEKGHVTEVYAVPVHRSGQIFLADLTGYIDTTTANNIYGRILLVRPDQWVIGFKRQVTMEYFRDVPGQSNGMVITLRLGLQFRDEAQAAACTYKVPVS